MYYLGVVLQCVLKAFFLVPAVLVDQVWVVDELLQRGDGGER